MPVLGLLRGHQLFHEPKAAQHDLGVGLSALPLALEVRSVWGTIIEVLRLRACACLRATQRGLSGVSKLVHDSVDVSGSDSWTRALVAHRPDQIAGKASPAARHAPICMRP